MDWNQLSDGHWTAIGPTGTRWDIIRYYDRYGCIVEQWDKPDWWADSLDAAKQLCEEVDARPPIPRDQWVEEEPPRDLDL